MKRPLILLLLGIGLSWGCSDRPVATNSKPSPSSLSPEVLSEETIARDGTLSADISDCVTNYNPEHNYFPDQTQLTHAKGFRVDYYRHYKVVTVTNPWLNADRSFEYVLVQCGTPIPDNYPDAQIITIPIRRSVVLSTTHLPYFDRLEQLDTIVGVRQIEDINNPIVRQNIEQQKIQSVGNRNTLDLEAIVELKPDLVTIFGIANVETSTIGQLQELGISTAVIAEYLEASPLAQAEWLKFMALFFNQEKEAETIFKTIVQEYQSMVNLTQNIPDRPTVLNGFDLEGTWYVAGGKSFIAQFIQDAGGRYLWSDNNSVGNVALDFEAVFAKGAKAEIWLNGNQKWQTLNDALLEDDRYGTFTAFQTGQVFNNDARLNPEGGNDYWESGILNPHIVLADLTKILHPNLLPDHTLVYYRKLK